MSNKLREALENLLEVIPKQDNDHDWWPDELSYAVDAAKAALSEKEDGWVDVNDRLPEVDESVLICYDGDVKLAYHDGDKWGDDEEYFLGSITHWQPLPQKPAQLKSKNE